MMMSIASGGAPSARRFSGNLPSVGCIEWPEPASLRISLPSWRMRKLLTSSGSGCPYGTPVSCALSSLSTPRITSWLL
jgi:hypothetical protein